MRCPDCNKFVGMENADPEINSTDATLDGRCVTVTTEVRLVRVCADCGTELKSLDVQPEDSFEFDDTPEFKALSEEDQKRVLAAADAGELEVDANESSSSVDEAGVERYAKNMITLNLSVDVNFSVPNTETLPKIEFSHPVELKEKHAAGEFEECC